MNITTLRTAIAEAERFLVKAKAVPIQRVKGEGMATGKSWDELPYRSVEAAACKRASMDLSRALSALRKSG